MKKLLAVLGVLLSGVVADPEAPYGPSGFRPNGPPFDLPQKNIQNTQQQQYLPPVDPRRPLNPNTEYGTPEEDVSVQGLPVPEQQPIFQNIQNTQQQQYLPPVNPRRPLNLNTEYGTPEEDVSVQGLPVHEQQPIFQVSPINGQLYNGPQFVSALRNLDNTDSYRQTQYQLQQEKYREFERQRQLEAAQSRNRANQSPNQQVPRQFAQTTSTTESSFTTRNTDDFRTESTTESLDLNEGETLEDSKKDNVKEKVTVEVSRQNLREYPGELFLSSLAQLQLQPQFVPFQQFSQLNAALQYQPVQQDVSKKQVGYDATTHFAALPSVLAQRQSIQPQALTPNQQEYAQSPALLVVPQDQARAGLVQPQQPLNQYQPFINNQYQPLVQSQGFSQPIVVQAQLNQPNEYAQPQQSENDETRQDQEQTYVYQQSYQPQEVVYQPQFPQPNQPQANQYQSPQQQNYFLPQAQLINYPQLAQQYQNGFAPQQVLNQQQVFQGQDALQSGIDVNQQGNGVDQNDKKDSDDENQDDGSTATAVATAFGARTQPRVFTRYGAPIPRVAANPHTTTESAVQDEVTEDAGAIAEANAFAAARRKNANAKLRNRRVRPIFTLDRSGHLVLAQEQ